MYSRSTLPENGILQRDNSDPPTWDKIMFVGMLCSEHEFHA